MKSPFTGGAADLVIEPKEQEFRKEPFTINQHEWQCVETGRYFTNDKLDRINRAQLHNRYREKHNIPFPDQIRATRQKYGLSASKMSQILGFGINTYRNYESGEVPQASNAKLIKLAAYPAEFQRLVVINETLSPKKAQKLTNKIDRLIEKENNSDERMLKKLLSYDRITPTIYSGYRDLDIEKLCNMIIFFAGTVEPLSFKLNKLLFYADFLHYQETGYAISGCTYRAIEPGPVLDGHKTLFEYFHREDRFNIEYVQFDNQENIGEQIQPLPQKVFNGDLFRPSEIKSLIRIAHQFKTVSSQEIIQKSQQEQAWKKYQEDNSLIAYDEAFWLTIDVE